MPELNFDKVYASLDLRIKDIENIDEFDELTREFLGKNSLISEERKKLSSLSKEDKKNYLRAFTSFILGAVLLGVHLSHIGFLGDAPLAEPLLSEPWLLILRIAMIGLFLLGAYFYNRFYSTQDDFFKSYHNFTFAGGAYGFLVFGSILTVMAPYFNYHPSFYEFFLAFAAGTGFGGYYFYEKYIA